MPIPLAWDRHRGELGIVLSAQVLFQSLSTWAKEALDSAALGRAERAELRRSLRESVLLHHGDRSVGPDCVNDRDVPVRIRAVSSNAHDVTYLRAAAGRYLRKVLLTRVTKDVFRVPAAERRACGYAEDVGGVLVGEIDALETVCAVVVRLLPQALLPETFETSCGLPRVL